MELSVVIPTFNCREEVSMALDALSRHTRDVETIVVNGPSTDGTTGMIHERDDVSVLVEVSTRNLNTSRNAGISQATGDVIALLGAEYRIGPTWEDAIQTSIRGSGVDAVTGPTSGGLANDVSKTPETRSIAGRTVTSVSGDNIALTASAVRTLDGFDDYFEVGGARDLAHRLAGLDMSVMWNPDMGVRGTLEVDGGQRTRMQRRQLPEPDGSESRHWCWKYRSNTYRLVKIYGLHPSVIGRTAFAAIGDARSCAVDVGRGTSAPTTWIGSGIDVLRNVAIGTKDGLRSRVLDGSRRRNPNGVSTLDSERVVECYDWR